MIAIEKLVELAENLTLQSERLSMRRFQSSDMEHELNAQQDPQVVRYIREPMAREQAEAHFAKCIAVYKAEEAEWLGLCVERSEDNQVVGAISFRLESIDSEVAEIGYRLNPKFHGQGFAVEAIRTLVTFLFETVKVHKVVAYCDPDNSPSYRLMEKLHMQREGLFREHFKMGEQRRDLCMYGVLAHEFSVDGK